MLVPVLLAPVVLLSAGMSLFIFRQALLTIKLSNWWVFVQLNAVCEEVIFGSPEDLKFSTETICLVAILIVLISMRIGVDEEGKRGVASLFQ
jgi:hypothetical protein